MMCQGWRRKMPKKLEIIASWVSRLLGPQTLGERERSKISQGEKMSLHQPCGDL
jgi:hypothetical protein